MHFFSDAFAACCQLPNHLVLTMYLHRLVFTEDVLERIMDHRFGNLFYWDC